MTIFIEGRLTVRPGHAFLRFVDDFTALELPLLVRSGVDVIGGWRRIGGPAEQLVNIYGFKGVAAMEEVGKVMQADPDYTKLATAYDWVGGSSFRYRRTMHAPLPFAPLDDLAELREPPDLRRQYVELRQRVLFGCEEKANELITSQLGAWEAAGVFRRALAYRTLHGEYGELTVIGILPGGRASFEELAETADPRIADELAQVVTEESANLLDPLPYSALQ
ncbi:hypothetical protein [Actinomadura sp. B10D3]|uniref:hypothetical protein n=1 Tax=Actinomadura sp. B10D3 TaxID=3153557 RepID=UPI00325D18A0